MIKSLRQHQRSVRSTKRPATGDPTPKAPALIFTIQPKLNFCPVDWPSGAMIPSRNGSAHLPRHSFLRSSLHHSRAYSAIEDHNIRFHLLHKKCGSRVRNQLFCPACKVVIERDETVRGYEVSKGQYVRVEDAELEALEAEANSSIDMREFIPIEKVDPIYFESSYYLAPDKGAISPTACSLTRWRRPAASRLLKRFSTTKRV
jgi:hypothetical protein